MNMQMLVFLKVLMSSKDVDAGRILKQERKLLEVISDLPPPPPPGSSQQEDACYVAIGAFEVDQMTYKFLYCDICKERRFSRKTVK